MRGHVQSGQFRDVEALYQNYDEGEREQIVFEHVMIRLDSILRSK
jgi:hypothetical protein